MKKIRGWITIGVLMLLMVSSVSTATAGVIIANRNEAPTDCTETTPPKEDTKVDSFGGVIIANVVGIIIANFTGIIIAQGSDGPVNCGIIIAQ